MSSLNLEVLIIDFLNTIEPKAIEIYNEFSLQHELGIYLRNYLPNYKVQFERNISYFFDKAQTIKKEIDIVIFDNNKTEKYAIEIKYPRKAAYSRRLYSFVKDIKFMEELKNLGFTETYCLTLVEQAPFYSGKNNQGIYKYFRDEHKVYGNIKNPITNPNDKNPPSISIDGIYPIIWKNLDGKRKYYLIKI